MKMKELMDFYRDKRVLVTGHTGFKGAWLCRILALAGAQVTGVFPGTAYGSQLV